jgi:hypothetical protein
MIQVFACLALIALGMGVDASYQRRIRLAECDAYETGYQQGLKENTIHKEITVPGVPILPEKTVPSMVAPVKMPDTFAEHVRKHGRAVVKLK